MPASAALYSVHSFHRQRPYPRHHRQHHHQSWLPVLLPVSARASDWLAAVAPLNGNQHRAIAILRQLNDVLYDRDRETTLT